MESCRFLSQSCSELRWHDQRQSVTEKLRINVKLKHAKCNGASLCFFVVSLHLIRLTQLKALQKTQLQLIIDALYGREREKSTSENLVLASIVPVLRNKDMDSDTFFANYTSKPLFVSGFFVYSPDVKQYKLRFLLKDLAKRGRRSFVNLLQAELFLFFEIRVIRPSLWKHLVQTKKNHDSWQIIIEYNTFLQQKFITSSSERRENERKNKKTKERRHVVLPHPLFLCNQTPNMSRRWLVVLSCFKGYVHSDWLSKASFDAEHVKNSEQFSPGYFHFEHSSEVKTLQKFTCASSGN